MFNHAYVAAPSRTTSRASILTGRMFYELEEGGIAIAPVGSESQMLVRYLKRGGRIRSEDLIGVIFVPLV